jgi:hypothetical protein
MTTLETDSSNLMKAKLGVQIQMVTTIAWGALFGFRDANTRDWKFYMQNNVSIQFYNCQRQEYRTERSVEFGSRELTYKKSDWQVRYVPVGKVNNIAVPLKLTRVFPGGGVAKATSSWRMLGGT